MGISVQQQKLYSGHWIPKDIYFINSDVDVKARIPILAVEAVTICPDYNETTDTNICPTPANSTAPVVTPMPAGIQVMGVGFGRELDGQPQGTPDKNAFLNVRTIDGLSVLDNPLFRNGYVITQDGITIGLTASNTAGMNFSKLTLRPNATDPRDWSPIECCMAVDSANCTAGKCTHRHRSKPNVHDTSLGDTGPSKCSPSPGQRLDSGCSFRNSREVCGG